MYDGAKFCVRQAHQLSYYLYNNVGVRQGEDLSAILFHCFLMTYIS